MLGILGLEMFHMVHLNYVYPSCIGYCISRMPFIVLFDVCGIQYSSCFGADLQFSLVIHEKLSLAGFMPSWLLNYRMLVI